MSRITLFSEENCSGAKDTNTRNLPNYQTISAARSLHVTDGIWIVYSEADYKGEVAVYEKGFYNVHPKIKNIRSFRKVLKQSDHPLIEVFKKPNYVDQIHDVKPNVPYSIMSYRVVDGVWLLYDDKEYKGNSVVSITGDQVKDVTELGLNGPVKSLRPYGTYEPPI